MSDWGLMMSAANKRKGAAFETDFLKYLRNEGHDVERLSKTGREDEGDVVWKNGGLVFIFELKNTTAINLTDYVRQAEVEARNYAKHRGLDKVPSYAAVVKKRNAGIGEAFVITPLHEYVDQTAIPF